MSRLLDWFSRKSATAAQPAMCWVYPDANIFMHFRPVDELPLAEILNASGPVTVVLTTTLLDELDSQKVKNPNPDLRDRAQRAIVRLREWKRKADSSLANGASLLFRTQRHHMDLRSLGLDEAIRDDHQLAEIMSALESQPGRHVLFTADFGAETRAQARNIESVSPPEEFRLQVPDTTQRELKKAQAEIQKLNARRPTLSLRFATGESHLVHAVSLPTNTTEGDIAELVEKKRQSLLMPVPKATYGEAFGLAAAHLAPSGGLGPTRDDIVRYNEKVEAHILKLKEHLRQFHSSDAELIARTLEVPLELRNDGSETATIVRIRVSTPIDVELRVERPTGHSAPKAPERPRGLTDLGGFHGLPDFGAVFPMPKPAPNVRGPWAMEGELSLIEFQVERALHKETYTLAPCFLIFPTIEAIRSVPLRVSILCGQISDWIDSELNIRVDFRPPGEEG